jgi:hypothetical protein
MNEKKRVNKYRKLLFLCFFFNMLILSMVEKCLLIIMINKKNHTLFLILKYIFSTFGFKTKIYNKNTSF